MPTVYDPQNDTVVAERMGFRAEVWPVTHPLTGEMAYHWRTSGRGQSREGSEHLRNKAEGAAKLALSQLCDLERGRRNEFAALNA